jgi:transcription elongation factor Elf1
VVDDMAHKECRVDNPRQVYRSLTKCPHCGSNETGTSTIASSSRHIDFYCDSCHRPYKVLASRVSTLSKYLARF